MSGIVGTSSAKSKVIGKSQDTAKAWVRFTNPATPAVLQESFNVSSIDNYTSDMWRVNFETPMATTGYTVAANDSQGDVNSISISVFNTAYFEAFSYNNSGTKQQKVWCCVVFGD